MVNKVEYCKVKTGVEITHINKFRTWAKSKWPVIDFVKYGKFPDQYITMVFPDYLGEEVFIRVMNGEFTEEKISSEFNKCQYA